MQLPHDCLGFDQLKLRLAPARAERCRLQERDACKLLAGGVAELGCECFRLIIERGLFVLGALWQEAVGARRQAQKTVNELTEENEAMMRRSSSLKARVSDLRSAKRALCASERAL